MSRDKKLREINRRAIEYDLEDFCESLQKHPGNIAVPAMGSTLITRAILHAADEFNAVQIAPAPQHIWFAIHEAHESDVIPCESEEAAYQALALKALNMRDDIPESWSMQETVAHWNDLTGDEYMRVSGPIEVYKEE